MLDSVVTAFRYVSQIGGWITLASDNERRSLHGISLKRSVQVLRGVTSRSDKGIRVDILVVSQLFNIPLQDEQQDWVVREWLFSRGRHGHTRATLHRLYMCRISRVTRSTSPGSDTVVRTALPTCTLEQSPFSSTITLGCKESIVHSSFELRTVPDYRQTSGLLQVELRYLFSEYPD